MKTFVLMAVIICYFSLHATSTDSFDQFVDAYARYGGDKYMIDEEIVQSAHVLQAAYLAEFCGAPEDVVIGLLFHDIGQVIDNRYTGNVAYLHATHDDIGSQWLLNNGFPADIADWVRFHTLAKVVLCMEDPSYYQHLSLASQQSYHIQKNKYLNEEGQKSLHAFNNHPRREDFLCQRKCDDMAKITGFCQPKTFEDYREMTVRVINGCGAPAANPSWSSHVDALHTYMCLDREGFEGFIANARTIPLTESSSR